jgi:nitrogen fixation protein FixH
VNLRLPTIRFREPGKLTGRRVLVMLIGFFGVVMVVNFAMVKAAISTFGGVDTQSPYEAGLEFQAEEARAGAQRARDWLVTEQIASEGATQLVTVVIADKDGKPVTGAEVSAVLAHPVDERRDETIELAEAGPGTYRVRADIPAGVWRLDLSVSRAGERLFRSQNRIIVP